MLNHQFTIRLEMKSDWRVGTGKGIPGGIDELISRDEDGFPHVPAKTVVGIWRDAMEQLCESLGDDFKDCVDSVFGSQPNLSDANHSVAPKPAAISIRPARLPEKLRAAFSIDPRYKRALTFVKAGVRIDRKTDSAADDMLRFIEMGRKGTVLEARVDLDRTNELISALLILSTRLVEKIGGGRRRGSGECEMKIRGVDQIMFEKAIDFVEKFGSSTSLEDVFPALGKCSFGTLESDWKYCDYTLTLKTPVTIASKVLGNVTETLDYIPGTYLIGHFARRLGGDFFSHVQKGDVQVSPATIAIGKSRGLTSPRVFVQEKVEKSKVYSLINGRPETTEATKPIRSGYIAVSKSSDEKLSIEHAPTPIVALMHNTIDDKEQRPNESVGGVYSREAIASATILRGRVYFRGCQPEFEGLKGELRIGTSKKDDYGWAEIDFGKPENLPSSATGAGEAIVYLESDCILRDDRLASSGAKSVIAKALGVDENAVDVLSIQTRRIESWQTGWGLPRPTVLAIQAGSVFRVTATGEHRLDQASREGIGERRGEGYGRILVNPEFLGTSEFTWIKKTADRVKPPAFNGELCNSRFAELVERTAWRNELALAAGRIAMKDELAKEFGLSGLTMSQIGGLRAVVMRMTATGGADLLKKWLSHVRKTRNRLDSWTEKRLKSLENMTSPDHLWTLVDKEFDALAPITDRELKKDLWPDAYREIFYACQHRIKRGGEKKIKDSNGGRNGEND